MELLFKITLNGSSGKVMQIRTYFIDNVKLLNARFAKKKIARQRHQSDTR